MEFTDIYSIWDTEKRFSKSPEDFFEKAIDHLKNKEDDDSCNYRNYCCLEYAWILKGRPYYKIWPAVLQSFEKMPLDVRLHDLKLDTQVIGIRFGKANQPKRDVLRLESLIAATHDDNGGLFILGFSFGGICHCPGCKGRDGCHWTTLVLRGKRSMTIDEWLAEGIFTPVKGGIVATTELAKLAARIAITVMLLANDPSIIEPDVLSKDRAEYNRTKDPERKRVIEERARRRGKIGWNIGESYETMPHYRRPHFGIRHTGKGGTIPRIVPIKGAVVHRNKLTRVPTGYITADGVEVEPE